MTDRNNPEQEEKSELVDISELSGMSSVNYSAVIS